MAVFRSTPQPYAEALLAELDAIESAYLEVLASSEVRNIDPNRRGSDITFLGYAKWGWTPSDSALEAARMKLLGQVRDLRPRFELLFPHPTPTVAKRHSQSLDLLERWLVRRRGDKTVPRTVDAAVEQLRAAVSVLRGGRELLPDDPIPVGSSSTPTRSSTARTSRPTPRSSGLGTKRTCFRSCCASSMTTSGQAAAPSCAKRRRRPIAG